MGKKVKKKAWSAQKDKHVPPISTPQPNIPTSENVEDGVLVKELPVCPHLHKGVNLEKVSSKMESSEPLKCEDCREVVIERRASKGKVKAKKEGADSSKSDSKSIWICLECGQFSCGGVGFPTTPHSHAARHAKQLRHHLAVQFANPNLRWCFHCNTLIPVQTLEENGERRDVLSDIVKVIKGRTSQPPSLDVEDVWFSSGSVTVDLKGEYTLSNNVQDRGGGYMVRGLVNLGNTCFFNSVLQNLLAMEKLRDYLLKLDRLVGPLTVSLKKLYIETDPTSGPRNVINPQALFGCLCAKASQFRGYQQHDSHELLRCLLDGLSFEESGSRKQYPSSAEDGNAQKPAITFVDAIFGGHISSTVSCLECGNASTVYEPFLDLSLPLPTKRSLTKKSQVAPRSKKPKLAPKRIGKFHPKVNKASDSSQIHIVSNVQTSATSSQGESVEAVAENFISPPAYLAQLESVNPRTVDSENGQALESPLVTQGLENEQIFDHPTERTMTTSEYSSQLDDLVPASLPNDHAAVTAKSSDTVSNDLDTAEESDVTSLSQDPGKELVGNDISLQPTIRVQPTSMEDSPLMPYDFSWLDYFGSGDKDNIASQTDYMSIVEKSEQSDAAGRDVVSLADEPQVHVQENEILLLPYTEIGSNSGAKEATISSENCEQDLLEFELLDDLLDEPEVEAGSTVNPFLSGTVSDTNGVAETGFMARNSSESDPDEVDNSDAPVAVQSCLAHFTTPDLLSKTEHAWQCERCSKTSLEKQTKLKNEVQNHVSYIVSTGGKDNILGDPSASGIDCALPNDVRTNCSDVSLEGAESCTTSLEIVPIQPISGLEKGESTEDYEMDSTSIKVARDATKRILLKKLPPISTIHLKRFSQDARGRLNTLNDHVDFRDTIDLKPYMDPSCCKDRDKYTEIGSNSGVNEATISSLICEQDSLGFDLFGDLLNEPKVEAGSTVNPFLSGTVSDTNGVAETGFMARNSSESYPDEVDNSDAPVAVQSCLAHFTTPELLSKTEHAWQCERCSKTSLEKQTKLKNEVQNHVSYIVSTGGKDNILGDPSASGIDCALPNDVRTNCSDVSLEGAESCTTSLEIVPIQPISGLEKGESTEDDKMDSTSIKVARDATKRILKKLPPISTIHLKRFSQDARGRLNTLNDHVDFRDTIDLKPYMDPSCCKDRDKYTEIGSNSGVYEATISSLICEQDSLGFDLFGDLLNKPEVEAGSTVNPFLSGTVSNGVAETGFMARNSSESDPDEVDNSDAPVSVQSCLAYFTTPELLSKTEHAWQCERCSKTSLEKQTKLKNEVQNHVSYIVSNGGKDNILGDPSASGIDCALPNDVRTNCSDVSLEGAESCTTSLEIVPIQPISGLEKGESTEDDEMDSTSIKVVRDATKRILLKKVPPILTIHLKRFCQDARGRLNKLNGHVDFRDTIDLKPYMDPSCCKDRDKYIYRLIGVVEHLGTIRGGHYVAYVRGGAKGTGKENGDSSWYHVSDTNVQDSTLEEVLRCEAYMLFYEEI